MVTRRPGEKHYVPLVGGNTRLRILQELYQETRDERFGTVECVYRPLTEESDILLAHLRENKLRGNLIFIDKALAVLDLKTTLESESRERQITLRRLAEIMTHRGLGISHTMISRMVCAAERLLPLIPQALNAGLGRPRLKRSMRSTKPFLNSGSDSYSVRKPSVPRPLQRCASATIHRNVTCNCSGPHWKMSRRRRRMSVSIPSDYRWMIFSAVVAKVPGTNRLDKTIS